MIRILFVFILFSLMIELGFAVEFEKKGKAIAKILGTKKAKAKKIDVDSKNEGVRVYYQKSGAKSYAVVQSRIYEPNCTHTWVIGLDLKAKVTEIRVIEMSCPHAFPTKKAAFLDQFKGKGPTDIKSLDKGISTIAKATGSSELTTDAVKIAISAVKKM